MDFKESNSDQPNSTPSLRSRSRSNSLESSGQGFGNEQSTVANAYSTIHNPSSFSPNHPRNFRPIQVFLHNVWARSNYEIDFEEEEVPWEVDGNLTFSNMYRRIQTKDGEWVENSKSELQTAPLLKDQSELSQQRKLSQNVENIGQLLMTVQTNIAGLTNLQQENSEHPHDFKIPRSPATTARNAQQSQSSENEQQECCIGFLNPEVDIPDQILQEATLRFARLKRKRKHPRILRLIKEERAMSDKMRVDGSALKSAKQPNSPESPKKVSYSKTSRFRAANRLKLNHSPSVSLETLSQESLSSLSKSVTRSDSENSSASANSPRVPTTPTTPQYSQYNRGTKTYDQFLEAQLESRGQDKKQPSQLAKYIESNLTGEVEKPRSVTMGGMDSATALRMNKNRKNLPTKGNDKMKLGSLLKSKIFMRRTQSQNTPQGESMLSISSRDESQEKATSQKGFAGKRLGLSISISKSSRANEVKRI